MTHGIFSKDLPLKGIDGVFTTDSYVEKLTGAYGNCEYRRIHGYSNTTVIPISMKELR